MTLIPTFATLAALTLALSLASAAQAQTAINPSNSYPIRITAPGAYKLTGNLVTNQQTAIEVSVPGVSIDLNGYSLIGSGRVCSQAQYSWALVCTTNNAGESAGVNGPEGVTVRNGSIQGFGYGVHIAGGRVENLLLRHNYAGVLHKYSGLPDNSTPPLLLDGLAVEANDGIGIYIKSGLITRSVIKGNGAGVQGTQWAVMNDSTVYRNQRGVTTLPTRGTRVFDNQVDFPGGAQTY